LPFEGPVSGVKVSLINDEFKLNPSDNLEGQSPLNMFISSTDDSVTMIEAEGDSVSENKVISAIEFAYNESKKLRDLQRDFIKESRVSTFEYTPYVIPEELLSDIEKNFLSKIEKFIWEDGENPNTEIIELYKETYSENLINDAISYFEKKSCRKGIIENKKRPDKRGMDDIRNLYIDIDILPRTHGSAIFQRGDTQVLSVVTLASEKQRQTIESIYGEESKKYMHHYNFPGWSVGELSRNIYYPSRRDIGHGALAERALERQIPSIEEFPYAIRVVSETLSSNGSSSMASVCGSTLALMAAGVSIKNPISGIAMGLVMDDDKYEILTDIQGPEDHFGDMDFKVAGSEKGITALQMDNKLKGISIPILKEALERAQIARHFILEKMLEVIPEPRLSISKYAPKIEIIKVDQKDIGSIIGSGGKVIKEIIEKSGAEVFISDDGNVSITSDVDGAVEKALSMVMDIVKEVEIGGIYTAKVVKITTFGIFVNITPTISGLVHVSEMADKFVKDPNVLVKVGDEVLVKIIGRDENGKLKLSMKQAKD
ncbi:polyribonucleotide nucleotidyltransferase, partial [Patescibacteria group bacterium]|nr:polyribonucleotide nucleotidyltransferase [Patescibacteria group bacterium]